MTSFGCPNHLLEEVHVLDNVGEDFITLSFYFSGTPHSLVRSREESIHKALTRMSLTIRKKAAGMSKKGKAKSKSGGPTAGLAEYRLLSKTDDGEEFEELDASTMTNEQWRSGMCIIVMQSYTFTVILNPPIGTVQFQCFR